MDFKDLLFLFYFFIKLTKNRKIRTLFIFPHFLLVFCPNMCVFYIVAHPSFVHLFVHLFIQEIFKFLWNTRGYNVVNMKINVTQCLAAGGQNTVEEVYMQAIKLEVCEEYARIVKGNTDEWLGQIRWEKTLWAGILICVESREVTKFSVSGNTESYT